ncbi:MAG TPA: hypothetical protein VFV46_09610 [Lacibacter sp.]|nr:hypothetical protein [Lacibacter sp.]
MACENDATENRTMNGAPQIRFVNVLSPGTNKKTSAVAEVEIK